MLQLVIKDYRALFHDSLKSMDISAFVIYLWLLAYPPVLHMSYAGYLCHFVYFIMLGMGIFLSRLYPNRMSKTLLLCPLSKDQRRRYIRTGYLLRVIGCVFLFLLLLLTAVISIHVHDGALPDDGWLWPGLIWQYALSMAGCHIYTAPVNPSSYPAKRTYRLPGNYEVWNFIQQLAAIFGGMILVSALTDEKPESVPEIVIESVVLLLQTAICIKVIRTYAKPVMQQAVDYEYSPFIQVSRKVRSR